MPKNTKTPPKTRKNTIFFRAYARKKSRKIAFALTREKNNHLPGLAQISQKRRNSLPAGGGWGGGGGGGPAGGPKSLLATPFTAVRTPVLNARLCAFFCVLYEALRCARVLTRVRGAFRDGGWRSARKAPDVDFFAWLPVRGAGMYGSAPAGIAVSGAFRRERRPPSRP